MLKGSLMNTRCSESGLDFVDPGCCVVCRAPSRPNSAVTYVFLFQASRSWRCGGDPIVSLS